MRARNRQSGAQLPESVAWLFCSLALQSRDSLHLASIALPALTTQAASKDGESRQSPPAFLPRGASRSTFDCARLFVTVISSTCPPPLPLNAISPPATTC